MSHYLDDDGYPTEEAEEILEKWDSEDREGFFQFIKSIWRYPDWGWEEVTNEEGNREYHISTGGWSGNEIILSAMKKNIIIWHYTWVQSRTGGHYIFEISKPSVSSPLRHDGEIR